MILQINIKTSGVISYCKYETGKSPAKVVVNLKNKIKLTMT